MSGEDHLTIWVEMQKRVWHGDTSSKAAFITLKKLPDESVIFRCPADADNIPTMVKQMLAMHAEELPKGSAHSFLLVSTDESGVQLSELPQTIRGSSQEAKAASVELMALQNATAKALANLDFANQLLLRNLEQKDDKLNTATEDKFALLDKLVQQQATNFEKELELARYEREQSRKDMMVKAGTENLMPILGVVFEHVAKKYLADNPEILGKLGGALNGKQPATEEPSNAAGPSVAEPRPDPISEAMQAEDRPSPTNGKGRSKRNTRALPA
jgi:hypothetical protein